MKITDTPDKPIFDILGNAILKDGWIACAFAIGSHSCEMRVGQVLGFSNGKISVQWYQDNRRWGTMKGRKSSIYSDLQRFIAIPAPTGEALI
jgi:hypothetical protein